LAKTPFENGASVERWCTSHLSTAVAAPTWPVKEMDAIFGLPDLPAIVKALETSGSEWAHKTLAALRQRSPLLLNVSLEQIRRARGMGLADDLRMERGLVRRCFHLRPGAGSETAEGIRALAIDKDHSPRWHPPAIEDVTAAQTAAFFDSPWPDHAHPLRHLA
jgi:enoyl-CoA hydratase